MLKKRRVLAAKVEATPGTAETLTAAEAVMNPYDIDIKPDIEMTERTGQVAFGRLPSTHGARGGTLTFKHRLEPGSSAQPQWVSVLWPACGLVHSSNFYTPRSESIGSNVKTITIGVFMDGKFKSLTGAVGNLKFFFNHGEAAYVEHTFRGIWVPPTDAALINPTTPTLKPLRFASAALTVGAYTPVIASLEVDLGNVITLRPDANSASGYKTALITDRKVVGKIDPESALVAAKDWYGEWIAHTEQEIAWSLASGGIGFAFSIPKAQITMPDEAEREGVQTEDITFQGNRSAAAGDDELSITLDIAA